MDIRGSLKQLNHELSLLREERVIYLAGGAALNLMGVSDRATFDADMLAPQIDEILKGASLKVASDLHLDSGWLNNGVKFFEAFLSPKWKTRSVLVLSLSNLKVHCLHRVDLLCLKLNAMSDRAGSDLEDILRISPSDSELEEAQMILSSVPHLSNSQEWRSTISTLIRIVKNGRD